MSPSESGGVRRLARLSGHLTASRPLGRGQLLLVRADEISDFAAVSLAALPLATLDLLGF